VDISDPADPIEIGCYDDIPGGYDTLGYAEGVAVLGNYAYLADGDSGLVILDISDPTHPVQTGYCDTPGEACNIAVTDDYAFVADWPEGLQIIDVTDPSHPTIAGHHDLPGRAYGVAVAGQLAYVADWDAGLQIVNVSNPSEPTIAGYYNTPGHAYGVAVAGKYAYVADQDHFEIFDCSAALGVGSSDFIPHPSSLILYPAYPNPFNLQTAISFQLSAFSPIRLAAYDIWGRETAVIAEGNYQAGSHRIIWNAPSAPAGEYFIRMTAGGLVQTQPVTLLK
jgi:hypothetical protein